MHLYLWNQAKQMNKNRLDKSENPDQYANVIRVDSDDRHRIGTLFKHIFVLPKRQSENNAIDYLKTCVIGLPIQT